MRYWNTLLLSVMGLFLGFSIGAQAPAKKPFTIALGEARAATCRSGVRLDIKPIDGFKMNMEYPTKLSAQAKPPVTILKPVQKKADAVRFTLPEAVFDVCYEVEKGQAAAGSIDVTIKFSVCNAERCIMFTENLSKPIGSTTRVR